MLKFQQVKHFCPNVPIILVGNKKDLRNDPKTKYTKHDLMQIQMPYNISLFFCYNWEQERALLAPNVSTGTN